MAAGEDQPQPIVLDTLLVPCGGVACLNVKSAGDLLERCVEPGAPAHCVDGLEAAGRHEPRPGIGGHAITRPPLYRCGKGIVQRFFGEVEEALHDAFTAAVERWPRDCVPANPRAWLVSAGRFKAIDAMRRRARFDASLEEIARRFDTETSDPTGRDEESVEDDRLRLIFTCCHPALPPDAQIALTLREVCGLTTEEIARAFLTGPPTVAQRIVRAKAKIRDARIPYEVPVRGDLPGRLDTVLHVIYLVFNEGYSASAGSSLTRPDLSGEAIRLGRLLIALLAEPEALGLLSLMLLHESRRAARTSPAGELVLLGDQDRSLWSGDLITEGSALVQQALSSRRFGPYTLQAAIAAVHAEAAIAAATDWARSEEHTSEL